MNVGIITLIINFGTQLHCFFEGDDGEEFKVKKSSYSKKIKKQMNKEKMGREKVENGKKSKINSDTIRLIQEKQFNFNVNKLSLLHVNVIIIKCN